MLNCRALLDLKCTGRFALTHSHGDTPGEPFSRPRPAGVECGRGQSTRKSDSRLDSAFDYGGDPALGIGYRGRTARPSRTRLAAHVSCLHLDPSNRRERWAKWTLAAAIGVPVLYVASFGPMCWVASRTNVGAGIFNVAYRPVRWVFHALDIEDNSGAARAFVWYARLGARDGWNWIGYTAVPEYDRQGQRRQLRNDIEAWDWESTVTP